MTYTLKKNIDRPNFRSLIFTSAGDNSNLNKWLEGNRQFDLWISYYGNKEGAFENDCDYYLARKDDKFGAMHFCYENWKDILDQYDAIMVADDDIILDANDLNNLFSIQKEHDLFALQPAFNPVGKISHSITREMPFSHIRFTSFIEMTCPLFRKDKLYAFLENFDPKLTGWGTDWWFLHVIGNNSENKAIAVVDSIPCVNPLDSTKGGKREIDLIIKYQQDRIKIWESIKKEKNLEIDEWQYEKYGSIPRPISFTTLKRACELVIIRLLKKLKLKYIN